MKIFRLLILCLLPVVSFAQPFVEGKDYQVLPEKAWNKPDPNGRVEVIEFFNYGCPWCYRFEPHIEKWLAKNHSKIKFFRVAVAFHSQWKLYARAYYTVRALGVENKVNLPIFKAIQDQGKSLDDIDSMAEFVSQHSVNKQDFLDAYHHSPSIDIYQQQGLDLVRKYQVSGVPAVVVAGKYKTDSRMSRGDADKMLKVVDYLIQLSQANA